MVREPRLVSYLPPFLQEYREIHTALEAEDPEFRLVWEGTDYVLRNEFILTADEYGIFRFEKLLGIVPVKGEDLESRRMAVLGRWYNVRPYTWRMLLERLRGIPCEEGKISVSHNFEEGYGLWVQVDTGEAPVGREVEYILGIMLPANIAAWVTYEIPEGTAVVYAGGAFEEAEILELREDTFAVLGGGIYAGGTAEEMDILRLRDSVPFSSFMVRNGHLWMETSGAGAAGFWIRNGHLMADTDVVPEADRYYINDEGHLIYRQ